MRPTHSTNYVRITEQRWSQSSDATTDTARLLQPARQSWCRASTTGAAAGWVSWCRDSTTGAGASWVSWCRASTTVQSWPPIAESVQTSGGNHTLRYEGFFTVWKQETKQEDG